MPEPLTPAQKLAFDALVEVTPASTIGGFAGEIDEGDGATSYQFAASMPGYPGWNWTVTIEQLPDSEPTVLETELMPAEGALLAPDWVPWSERMEEYRAAQIAAGEALEDGEDGDLADASEDDEPDDDDESGDESDDESDDDDDDDDSDDDDILGSDVLHGGDLDGVDIDELDPSVNEVGDDGDDDSDDDEDVDDGADASDDADDADAEVSGDRGDDSGASTVGVDEGDESEADAGGTGEQPPRVTRGRQRARKEQKPDEAE